MWWNSRVFFGSSDYIFLVLVPVGAGIQAPHVRSCAGASPLRAAHELEQGGRGGPRSFSPERWFGLPLLISRNGVHAEYASPISVNLCLLNVPPPVSISLLLYPLPFPFWLRVCRDRIPTVGQASSVPGPPSSNGGRLSLGHSAGDGTRTLGAVSSLPRDCQTISLSTARGLGTEFSGQGVFAALLATGVLERAGMASLWVNGMPQAYCRNPRPKSRFWPVRGKPAHAENSDSSRPRGRCETEKSSPCARSVLRRCRWWPGRRRGLVSGE